MKKSKVRLPIIVLGVLSVFLILGCPPPEPPNPTNPSKPGGGGTTTDKVWTESGVLKDDSFPNGLYGYSLGVSDNTVIVGSIDTGLNSGAGFIYTKGDNWTLSKQVSSADGGGDRTYGFGRSVAVSGDTSLVGAFKGIRDVGRLHIYTKGSESQIIEGVNPGDRFGYSVAISGDTAIVGSPHVSIRGRVRLFTKGDDGTWAAAPMQSALTGATSDLITASDPKDPDTFGSSVAISGNTAIVGAPGKDSKRGAVYILTKGSDGIWKVTQKLTASDGADGDIFGFSVAISGDTAIVGAKESKGTDGTSYIYTKGSDGTWKETQRLTVAAGSKGKFGHAVAISGDTAVVGAPLDGGKGGAAYMYTKGSNGIWTELKKITNSNVIANDMFGYAVAVSEDTLVISAPHKKVGSGTGAVYTYTLQ